MSGRNLLILFFFAYALSLQSQSIELSVQKGHSGNINVVVFNSNGTLLASGGSDNQIILWHVPTGKEAASFVSLSSQPITDLKFIDNDNFLLVRFEDGSLQRWNIITSKQESSLPGDNQIIFKSSKIIYTKDSSEQVFTDRFYLRKRNTKTGKVKFSKVPIDISKVFTSVIVSEKNNKILAANEDGSIYVYNLSTGKSENMLEGHYSSANSICLSPDETIAASASSDRSIILWDLKSLQQLKRLYAFAFRFETLSFDHSGFQLAVGDELGRGRVVDLASSRVKVSTFQWHDQKVGSVAFSPDDKTIYTGGFDDRIKSFDALTGEQKLSNRYKTYFSSSDLLRKAVGAYREPYAWVNSIAVSPNEIYLASGGGWRESDVRNQPQPIVLKNLKTNSVKFLKTHQEHVSSILFQDEHRMITAGYNNLISWQFNSVLNQYLFRELPIKGITGITRLAAAHDTNILIAAGKKLFLYDLEKETIIDSLTEKNEITDVAYHLSDSTIALSVFNELIFLKKSLHGERHSIAQAHNDRITDIDFNPGRSILASCSWDATIKLWNTSTYELLTTIIPIGKDDHIILTPDNYYYGTRHSFRGIGFKYGKQFISPEQFDLRYNRPDIVLARLGFVPENVVRAFNRAYRKRLQKMNFTEEMLNTEIQLPEIIITSNQVISVDQPTFNLKISAQDQRYELDRIQIFINDIPVFGTSGIDLRSRNTQKVEEAIPVQLSPGKNKIQVSCLNKKGVESLIQTMVVDYKDEKPIKPVLHLAVISVSKYEDASKNLKYAAKDGRDIIKMFSQFGLFSKVIVDSLIDSRATKENILDLHDTFMKSSIQDHVVVYVSGHGMLDENLDFYFGTHNIDFNNPAAKGIRYEDLESLLDGIPARNKLLLMDACHSGEVDKSNIIASERTVNTGDTRGTVKTYTYPIEAETEHYQVGIKTSFELMQEVFSNFSKGSGAVVISAAAGNSYALESDEWKNGVFTFSLLNGIKTRQADLNHDDKITVSELKDYVSREVEKLTDGEQKPTSRRESLEFDFRVY